MCPCDDSHIDGLLGSSVFLSLSTLSKIFISRCDLRHSIREYVIVLEWMGPGCDTVTGGSLRIVPIKTLLLAQVCSDCLVNYNVGLFELYNWQIYISQGIAVCNGISLFHDVVRGSNSNRSIER